MKLEGKLFKDGRTWIVEVPALELVTQGTSRSDAMVMIEDAVESLVNCEGFKASALPSDGATFLLGANMLAPLLALVLRRQRQAKELSFADAAERLNQKSRNAFARYEQAALSTKASGGVAVRAPSVEKFEELLHAISPECELILAVRAPR